MQNKVKLAFFLAAFGLIQIKCNGDQRNQTKTPSKENQNIATSQQAKLIDTLERRLIDAGLIDVQGLNPKIQVDLKYASEDNFMKTNVYGQLSRAYLQPIAAEKTALAQKLLDNLKPGYVLVIYDAVRPRWVQTKMWNLLDSIPPLKREKFVSNPRKGSLHNYGLAVDVSILDSKGNVLDMGAGYDDPREIAYPSLEYRFIQSGELTTKQIENRKLLRRIMYESGFKGIPTEWWHFNAIPLIKAKREYQLVE